MSSIQLRLVRPLVWSVVSDGTTRLLDPRRGSEVRMVAWTADVLAALEKEPSLEAALASPLHREDAPRPERVRRFLLDLEKAGYVRLDVPLPERLGDWRVEAELGRGAVGIAYRCVDDAGRVGVAKRAWEYLYPLRATNALTRWESTVLASLDEPGIVRLLQPAGNDSPAWLVRGLAEGESLTSLHDGRPASPADAQRIAREAASIVSRLHARGFLLVDGKPGNFFLRGEGLVLSDAGNCLRLDGSGPDGARPGGSRGFVAPEVAAGGPPSRASDAWTVGRLLAFLATGRLPRTDERLADLARGVPDELAPALARLCADAPEARPSDPLDAFQD